jgi:hypothetical protein
VHRESGFIEFAISGASINRVSFDDEQMPTLARETEVPFIGLSYANSWFSLGYISQSYGEQQSFEFGDRRRRVIESVGLNKTSVALGLGNVLSDDEKFTYGFGISLELFEGGFGRDAKYKASGNTYSLKTAYQFNKAFARHDIGLGLSFGMSYSDEVTPDLENTDNVVLRPEIKQVGASVELTHLNTSLPWVLSISADVADAETQSNLLTDRFILGGSTRTGAEIRLLQPFGTEIDLALRAGQKTYDDLDSSFSSAGLGFNYGNLFVDLSGHEDEFADGEVAYHVSLTWTF